MAKDVGKKDSGKSISHPVPTKQKSAAKEDTEFFRTGIEGLDSLFKEGIPTKSSILVAGGAGSGKTLMCMQILVNAVKRGKKCFNMSFEESEERLRNHMKRFGWDLGAKDLLRREMEILQRKANAVIWLNPLAGELDYEPICKGMQTALPYVDYFLPANSLNDLNLVGRTLTRVMLH